jgi:hypothetical protein
MKQDLISYSHGVGRLYAHIRFKIKYCHKVFEKEPEFRYACEKLFYEIAYQNQIDIEYFWGSGLWARSIYFYGVGRDKK